MALENPDSETAAYLTREITDILHWSSPKTADRHTLRNFNVFNVTDDGELVISEPPTTPKQPIIPDRVFTRNADFRNKRVTKLETEKEEVAKFV
jgi:hypothetical protein